MLLGIPDLVQFEVINPQSVLFVVLDSCRYDTFESAHAPNMKAIGPLHKAASPSYFTFGSHSAMFMGFTPGLAAVKQPFLNPKLAKVFKLASGDWSKSNDQAFTLDGRNIIDGFNRQGYATIGSGAVSWFDPTLESGRVLSKDFEHFFYPGAYDEIDLQLEFLDKQIESAGAKPMFVFLNLGETHVPYYFKGAPWAPDDNPCMPFQEIDRSGDCRERQRLACEYIDGKLKPLLDRFSHATTLICADHGDCWGEDGLWEHGVSHEFTLTVPLILRVSGRPVDEQNAREVARLNSCEGAQNLSSLDHQLGRLRRRVKKKAEQLK